MLWVGLTGGIASGKSTVADFFREAGIPVADADRTAHKVMAKGSEGYEAVLQNFGRDILDVNGLIDRKKLGAIVFADPHQRERLEAIIHPLVQRATIDFRNHNLGLNYPIAVYDVPLLFEKRLQKQFDRVIVVTCSESTQLARLMRKTGMSEADARARVSAQLPMSMKTQGADIVIENEGTLEDLKQKALDCLKELQESVP